MTSSSFDAKTSVVVPDETPTIDPLILEQVKARLKNEEEFSGNLLRLLEQQERELNALRKYFQMSKEVDVAQKELKAVDKRTKKGKDADAKLNQLCVSLERMKVNVEETSLNLGMRLQGGADNGRQLAIQQKKTDELTDMMKNFAVSKETKALANTNLLNKYNNTNGAGLGPEKGNEIQKFFGSKAMVTAKNWAVMNTSQQMTLLNDVNLQRKVNVVLHSMSAQDELLNACQLTLSGLILEADSMDALLKLNQERYRKGLKKLKMELKQIPEGDFTKTLMKKREISNLKCDNKALIPLWRKKRTLVKVNIKKIEELIQKIKEMMKEEYFEKQMEKVIKEQIEPQVGYGARYKLNTTTIWYPVVNGQTLNVWFKVLRNEKGKRQWFYVKQEDVFHLKFKGPRFPGEEVEEKDEVDTMYDEAQEDV
mmetsp:Transcript_4177/g.5665  ORF Transcript_4177/g.5665 Transcript_4177/m.5665 type:complete len:424 (+) Transcript_4177:59-1330(+)